MDEAFLEASKPLRHLNPSTSAALGSGTYPLLRCRSQQPQVHRNHGGESLSHEGGAPVPPVSVDHAQDGAGSIRLIVGEMGIFEGVVTWRNATVDKRQVLRLQPRPGIACGCCVHEGVGALLVG